MKIGAESGPVVVHIEQAYLEAPRWLHVQPAAHLIRDSVDGSRVTAGAAARNVRAGSANQTLHKRGDPPSISHAAEDPGPVMISIEHGLGPTDRHEVVAAVSNDL